MIAYYPGRRGRGLKCSTLLLKPQGKGPHSANVDLSCVLDQTGPDGVDVRVMISVHLLAKATVG